APQAAQKQPHYHATAPHSQAKGPAPADPTTTRPPQCDAAPKAERARAHPAQTDARATAPPAKDQIHLATHPSPLPQPPLPSPHTPKPHPAPLKKPNPPAAQPQAAQGRSAAASRAAQQHPQPQLPAPPHPARREAEPPAGSCSGRRRPPAAPKT